MITVGLDFGTHQTKVCVEHKEGNELRYEFCKFTDNNGKPQYTIPSLICIDEQGFLSYGYEAVSKLNSSDNRDATNTVVKYFKQAVFTNQDISLTFNEAMILSIWYLAYLLFDLQERYGKDFTTQIGVPADGQTMKQKRELATCLLLSAFRLVELEFNNDKSAFLNTCISDLRKITKIDPFSEDKKSYYGILVFPEAYACLLPLVKNRKIDTGMSLMVDIGGGTTDISFFTIENARPQVYGFYSVDKGLNFLTNASVTKSRVSTNIESASEILPHRIPPFENEIKQKCIKNKKKLDRAFYDYVNLPHSNLNRVLENRPIIYTGGGSVFHRLRSPYLGFKDVIHVSRNNWRSECVENIDEISKLALCPILSTAYGLAVSMTDDNIKCKAFNKIFSECPQKGTNQPKKLNSRFGSALGSFDYADDWDALK